MTFWAVEQGELIEYQRSGECNQCGDCCRAGISYQMEVGFRERGHPPEVDETEKETFEWTNREGWNMFLAQGTWWYFKVMFAEEEPDRSCGDLDCTGEKCFCASWQDDSFRPICQYWPFHPDHVKAFPECSFTFEKVEEELLDS